jgi:hypothetical protein
MFHPKTSLRLRWQMRNRATAHIAAYVELSAATLRFTDFKWHHLDYLSLESVSLGLSALRPYWGSVCVKPSGKLQHRSAAWSPGYIAEHLVDYTVFTGKYLFFYPSGALMVSGIAGLWACRPDFLNRFHGLGLYEWWETGRFRTSSRCSSCNIWGQITYKVKPVKRNSCAKALTLNRDAYIFINKEKW